MTTDELILRAKQVLRGNDAGDFTLPSATQYPHQWNWDSAFVALGLSHFDLPRAQAEVSSLREKEEYLLEEFLRGARGSGADDGRRADTAVRERVDPLELPVDARRQHALDRRNLTSVDCVLRGAIYLDSHITVDDAVLDTVLCA